MTTNKTRYISTLKAQKKAVLDIESHIKTTIRKKTTPIFKSALEVSKKKFNKIKTDDELANHIQDGELPYNIEAGCFVLSGVKGEIKDKLIASNIGIYDKVNDLYYAPLDTLNALSSVDIKKLIVDVEAFYLKKAEKTVQTLDDGESITNEALATADYRGKELSLLLANQLKTFKFFSEDRIDSITSTFNEVVGYESNIIFSDQIKKTKDKIFKNLFLARSEGFIGDALKEEHRNLIETRAENVASHETNATINKVEEAILSKFGFQYFTWFHPDPNGKTSRPLHVLRYKESINHRVIYDSKNIPFQMPSEEINCRCWAVWLKGTLAELEKQGYKLFQG